MNAARTLTAVLLLSLCLAAACTSSPLGESQLAAVAASRLVVAGDTLQLDGAPVTTMPEGWEPSVAPLIGLSLALRQGGALYWLRYPTREIPPPYTPYEAVAVRVGGASPGSVAIAPNFVLAQAWDAKSSVWLAGHMNTGRTNYWDVLYLYDTQSGKITWVNALFERNSVVVDKVYARYADVTVRHLADQPPFDADWEADPTPATYRVYADGRVEPRKQ